ncbi:phosphoribosylformylglycinamidine synthase [Candidatus Parcubacteria bacterium]|nr:phosphoribosylformylglycinamidine synthase [Candidatus Parcubacteria bacterium]
MLIYKEINALASFQKNNLLKKLKKLDENITDVGAEYVHFVDSGKLSTNDDRILAQLLTYGEKYQGDRQGELMLVLPRPGTISPWSSKSTDIALNSGLKKIRRIERGRAYYIKSAKPLAKNIISDLLHDRMTQCIVERFEQAAVLFEGHKPKTYQVIEILAGGKEVLNKANTSLGLALSDEEIDYLYDAYKDIGRNPSDAELMMFSVVNSEHCRHKIFNAKWIVDGKPAEKSLFKMIKNTYEKNPGGVLSAYSDNAAVLKGPSTQQFYPGQKHVYDYRNEAAHLVIKAETHNHPTAIAPFPGAATGIGGEIRDEGATGRGARPKMGFSGFSVSNLNLAGLPQPWETDYGKPDIFSSPLDIMIDGPLGGASFANEYGRVNLAGYFRTFEQDFDGERRGYHKPLMIAGGLGAIRGNQVQKNKISEGDLLIVLGGPAMLIGLGGGAISSLQAGKADSQLDFASVQRGNGEIQRRAQEVIDSCWRDDENPIISIHDVGAGGLSNALPELVHDNSLGAEIEMRDIPSAEPGMSPLEIWSNEAQERYVLAINEKNLDKFKDLCDRERCPFAVVGKATEKEILVVNDRDFKNNPVNIPMDLLFGSPPKMTRKIDSRQLTVDSKKFDVKNIKFEEAIERVLHMPSVGSKKFLITIADRTVGGMSVRDQMVGPWQVPVSDLAVTAASFESNAGEALAIGERSPLALINAPASGRMAIGEAITNIAAGKINKLSDIKLSANWMAASGYRGEDKNLFETVKAVGEDFCPALGLTIPVGKDSLHMRTVWEEDGQEKSVSSPLSLVISAFAPVYDTAKTLSPQLKPDFGCQLIAVDLGKGKNRLGGSALAQAYGQVGNESPDIDAATLKHFFETIQKLNNQDKILAYHDRSDGGFITTLLEMSFASRIGLEISVKGQTFHRLFAEELGAVIQVKNSDAKQVIGLFGGYAWKIAQPARSQKIIINDSENHYSFDRAELESMWADTSYHIQKLRDNPETAQQEFDAIKDDNDPGISPHITPHFSNFQGQSLEIVEERPRVAIFREQGINGQIEMAAAFDRAGFEAIDLHLSDLMSGKRFLDEFSVLAACGGFSYGDVLGAGEGWAKSILFNDKLRNEFKKFFQREDTLSLGVCNGCQMLSALRELIPGAEHWPRFLQNQSGRYEARLVSVKIGDSRSKLFKNMAGSILPIPVAHGEGRAVFSSDKDIKYSLQNKLICANYVDNYRNITEQYPLNPNGSEKGITSLTSEDGRATIIMPHPERVFLTKQLSWHPADWSEESPWLKIFQNAREWIG